MNPEELNKCLQKFYVAARKKDGNYYSEVNAQRRAAAKSRINRIDESLPPDLLQAVQQTREPARG